MTLKENLERAKWPITFFLVAILMTTLWQHFIGVPQSRRQYIAFYKKDIRNGTLNYVYASNGGTRIKIDGVNEVFTFYPDYADYNLSFASIAEVGDIVIKPSRTDTIILVHHRKEYRFTFEKLVPGYQIPE
ncbi:hypothetical protein [Pinibacter soli]|uniref:Uncharacterized protein n=1 Tax=Pinibacter soli TaxID=3044211 RepID=A0ABT6RFL8_9BACT|nr:hypothetical protein [Pinibacter soli]MDI3320657.1 hypothetical protein [Pinibacter soli]